MSLKGMSGSCDSWLKIGGINEEAHEVDGLTFVMPTRMVIMLYH